MSDERKQLAIALVNLSRNSDFLIFMEWLKENSWWGQGPFDASNFEALRAAHIEGRQSLIRLTEIEIEEARAILNHE